MLELMVTLALAGILMAIATWGMRSYLVANRQQGTATDIRSALRSAAEQSLSEGRTYCVYFTATDWTVYKSSCAAGSTKANGPNRVDDSSITLTSVSFVPPGTAIPNQTTVCPTANKCAYFYPRGTALPGSLHVSRPGKTYSINVEGLTGRVSLA